MGDEAFGIHIELPSLNAKRTIFFITMLLCLNKSKVAMLTIQLLCSRGIERWSDQEALKCAHEIAYIKLKTAECASNSTFG